MKEVQAPNSKIKLWTQEVYHQSAFQEQKHLNGEF